jgi:hypothetical protein
MLDEKSLAHALALMSNGKAPTKVMDRGSIIHRLLLGKGSEYHVIQHSDWRTKDAQTQRDAARADGRVPVLAHDFEDYCTASESLRVQLADRGIVLNGRSELAIEWTEDTAHGPVLCKGMLDHCWLDVGLILDLKITENAAPSAVERTAENLRYGIQWAAYTRALSALNPDLIGRIGFAFAFCEPDPPYAINLTEPDGIFQQLGVQRWRRAVTTWAECAKSQRWPSYGTSVNPITAPTWALAKEGFTADER